MTKVNFEAFDEVNGFVWPKYDKHCREVLFDHSRSLDWVLGFVEKKGIVVQAGGNVGVWPRLLAEHFDYVYTFEPEHLNFTALVANCRQLFNVIPFRAALGYNGQGVAMGRDHAEYQNCGACRVVGPGPVPTMSIDDLNLSACDLIYLDVEGYEYDALRGATETILEHRPVICVEEKGLGEKYGHKELAALRYLTDSKNLRYKIVGRQGKDVVLRYDG